MPARDTNIHIHLSAFQAEPPLQPHWHSSLALPHPQQKLLNTCELSAAEIEISEIMRGTAEQVTIYFNQKILRAILLTSPYYFPCLVMKALVCSLKWYSFGFNGDFSITTFSYFCTLGFVTWTLLWKHAIPKNMLTHKTRVLICRA